MTEAPQPDQVVEPMQDEQLHADHVHADHVAEERLHPEDNSNVEASNKKQDTMRDEIRAGWCRALRRG